MDDLKIRVYLPEASAWWSGDSESTTESTATVFPHPDTSAVDGDVCRKVSHVVGDLLVSGTARVEVVFYTKDDAQFASLHVDATTHTVEMHETGTAPEKSGLVAAFGKAMMDNIRAYGLAAMFEAAVSKIKEGVDPEPPSEESELERLIQEVIQHTKADIIKPTETLDDYVCTPELKAELQEIADIFKNEKEYAELGVTLPKGVLLKGVPGTGKTYAARCIAGTTDAIFMSCTASALQGQYIGSGAENIRQVFQGARVLRERSKKPVILFLDELDSFGTRERRGSSGDEENRTLNQLLAEMSGFKDATGILLLGATNYPDRLDPAALRSGRFSRQITIEIPEDDARQNLLKFYFDKIKMPRVEGAEDTSTLSSITKGFTPADIAELANETALLALRKKMREIDLNTVNEAIDRIITKETRAASKPADMQVSVHEAGHVLAEYLYQDTVSIKVTNYQYGSAGGFTQPNTIEQPLMSKALFFARIRTLLAGRAAEQVLSPDISVGASDDLRRAKLLAEDAICKYDFVGRTADPMEIQVQKLLDQEFRTVVDDFEKPGNKSILKTITNALMEKRVLYTPQLVACGLLPKEFTL